MKDTLHQTRIGFETPCPAFNLCCMFSCDLVWPCMTLQQTAWGYVESSTSCSTASQHYTLHVPRYCKRCSCQFTLLSLQGIFQSTHLIDWKWTVNCFPLDSLHKARRSGDRSDSFLHRVCIILYLVHVGLYFMLWLELSRCVLSICHGWFRISMNFRHVSHVDLYTPKAHEQLFSDLFAKTETYLEAVQVGQININRLTHPRWEDTTDIFGW